MVFLEGLHRRSSWKDFTEVLDLWAEVFTEGLHRCSRCSGMFRRRRAPSLRRARARLAPSLRCEMHLLEGRAQAVTIQLALGSLGTSASPMDGGGVRDDDV